MSHDAARFAYQEMEATGSSGVQLVVMLYDGAIRFLNDASNSVRQKDLQGKIVAVDRALAIIGELQGTLRMEEGGEIAKSLDTLYTYMTNRILDGSMKLDTRPFDEVVKLLTNLNGAWKTIAQPKHSQDALPQNASAPLEIFG